MGSWVPTGSVVSKLGGSGRCEVANQRQKHAVFAPFERFGRFGPEAQINLRCMCSAEGRRLSTIGVSAPVSPPATSRLGAAGALCFQADLHARSMAGDVASAATSPFNLCAVCKIAVLGPRAFAVFMSRLVGWPAGLLAGWPAMYGAASSGRQLARAAARSVMLPSREQQRRRSTHHTGGSGGPRRRSTDTEREKSTYLERNMAVLVSGFADRDCAAYKEEYAGLGFSPKHNAGLTPDNSVLYA